MYIKEIEEVKEHLDLLLKKQVIDSWELPYENLLTRRSAAIFFVNPSSSIKIERLSEHFSNFEHFSYRENSERKLSKLAFRIVFNPEEKNL